MDDTADLHEQFVSLCNYNPIPAMDVVSRTFLDVESPDIPTFQKPNIFCDKHIDQSLFLKHVRLVPTLHVDISKSIDVAISLVKESGKRLPPIEYSALFPSDGRRGMREYMYQPVFDAVGVADRYAPTAGTYCSSVASTLVLHPGMPDWYSMLHLRFFSAKYRNFSLRDDEYSYCFDVNRKDYYDYYPFPAFWNSLESTSFELLRQICQRYPKLGVWQMLTPGAESTLRDMDKWADPACQQFNYEFCRTKGCPPENVLPRVVDATSTSWGMPMAAFVESSSPKRSKRHRSHSASRVGTVRRSERLRMTYGTQTARGKATPRDTEIPLKKPKWNVVTIPPRSAKFFDDPTSLLIQHAWSMAANRDSTFIIFNSGTYERIGFRHRETQTLFLSDLIDVSNCKDPGYGKIHIGLYVSILKDVINRISQYKDIEKKNEGPRSRKRKRESSFSATESRPRPRTRAYNMWKEAENEARRKRKESFQILCGEIALRELALLQMRFAGYNSVAPAAMMRIGQSLHKAPDPTWKAPTTSDRYQPHQYFILTLISEIANGAVGFAYRATIKILATDGSTLTHDVVVKLAFGLQQQERIRHEDSIYKHLASANVRGIPIVYGLFEDVESGVIALLMEDAGETVLKRMDRKRFSFYHITESERAGFERTLRDIHKAGVRHRDIRAENLTVDKDGNAYIVDFDRAKIDQEMNATQREWDLLQDFFRGVHPEYEQTTKESTASEDSEESIDERELFLSQFFGKQASGKSSENDEGSHKSS